MSEERFVVKKDGLVFHIYDNKLEEYYETIVADYDTLVEVARMLNNLERKNRCCQKKVETLSKFADPVEVNKYWESLTNE